MRFILHKDHINFFNHEGYIELSDILSSHDILQLKYLLNSSTSESPYDHYRENFEIQKLTIKPRLIQIATQLAVLKKLRLAYTYYAPSKPLNATNECLDSLVLGLTICLKTNTCYFFSTKREIEIPPVSDPYTIFFAKDPCMVSFVPKDPKKPLLNALGYDVGDCLNSKHHPLVTAPF